MIDIHTLHISPGHVLVRQHRTPTQVGAIALPDSTVKAESKGEVLASTISTIPVGAVLWFPEFAGMTLDLKDGQDYRVLPEKSCTAWVVPT